jgi:hypothetical protein
MGSAGMSIYRAVRAVLAVSFLVSLCLAIPDGAGAQEPTVALTLASQTPFTSTTDPVLELAITARNTGEDPIDDLSVGLSIGPRVISRVAYEQSLVDGPGSVLICCASLPQSGILEPGQTRTFTVRLNVTEDAPEIGSALDSAVYPAQVDLRSHAVPLASLNTALIHLARAPERPMRLGWWAELSGPNAFGPDGRLADPSMETMVAPEGSLGAEVAALTRIAADPDFRVPLDVVVEPSLLDQVSRMSQGYEREDGSTVDADAAPATDAASVMRSLRDVSAAANLQVTAMPFSAPLLPAMVSGGLQDDLDRQRALGDATVRELLEVEPTAAVERPPDGALDEASIDEIAGRGAAAILANADTVERGVQLNDFAPLPAATLTTSSGTSVDLVLPDPGVTTLLGDPTLLADPVRAAQAVLGEIATIWREQPVPAPQPDGSETVRGVAVALPSTLPAGVWGPLTRRLADAPFLVPLHGQDFVEQVNPLQTASELALPSTARFSREYVQDLRDQERRVEAYRSMLPDQDAGAAPDRMHRDLLTAEGREYIGTGEAAGRAWIDHVNAETSTVFARVVPVEPQAFTLTSSEGSVPLRMGDPGAIPLTVQIQLRSSKFEFPDGNEQTVTLTRPDQIVTFTVEAKAAGTQTIRVKTRAPSGRTLDERNLAVRTTTVNAIALAITAAAAVILLLLWSRRYIRRPRS